MPEAMLTIGHSNHTWEAFADLLSVYGVQVVVDTRTNPVSRFAHFANARSLPRLLHAQGMRYVYLGDSLGGKPADRSSYDGKGKPDYRKMRSKALFRNGLDELLKLAEDSTVALMCAEEDPSKCHRRLLIGPALEERGVELRHIRSDGTVQGSEAPGTKRAYRQQLQGVLPFEEDND